MRKMILNLIVQYNFSYEVGKLWIFDQKEKYIFLIDDCWHVIQNKIAASVANNVENILTKKSNILCPKNKIRNN